MKNKHISIIALLFLVNLTSLVGIDKKLGDFKTLYGNKIDLYNLGSKQLNEKMYFNSMFPDTEEVIDFENQRVAISTKINGIDIYPTIYIPIDLYFENLFRYTFDKKLYDVTLALFNLEERTTASGLIPDLVFDLPKFARSKAVRRIFGEKAGRLSFTGSEKLTISATDTKNDNLGLSESGQGGGLTPKMNQKLNMRLKGTIGEKIHVDLKYNSDQEESFFDPNNINIEYKGNEDEIVKSVQAGDISLNLSGSEFIGYSSSSQGLFGIKSELEVGNFALTTIMSQEEGQKNKRTFTGKTQSDSSIVEARDFSKRDKYYVVNPYEFYYLFQEGDIIPGTESNPQPIPTGWINNAIRFDANGSLVIQDDQILPADGTFEVYLDDLDGTNNNTAIPGFEEIQGDSPFTPQFDLLDEGTDYVYDYESGILHFFKNIDKKYTIGVRYTQRNGIRVPAYDASNEEELYVKLLRTKNQNYNPQMDPKIFNFEHLDENGDGLPDNRFYTWHYQLRNTYSLNSANITNEGFSLDVFTVNVDDNTFNYDISSDIDGGGYTTLNEYLRLDTNGDSKIDGSDTSVDLSSGTILYPFLEPFLPLGDTLVYQAENESIHSDDYEIKMVVKGKIGTDELSLGQTNILRGSVSVHVNGIEQKENIDFHVDYDFGKITFLTPAGKDPNAKIEIDYEFKSGFGLDKKSMFGLRADYKAFENFTIGSTFIYRTETVQDKHPKIGEENIELMLADIDGNFTVKPRFMTDMIDWLPLISTDTESSFTLSGEVALSVPNIYGNPDGKKKEAYIDDMEGILDEYPLGVTRKSWQLASSPETTLYPKARTHWFNPDNTKMKDVYDPSTMDTDEENEDVNILALKIVKPQIVNPNSVNKAWGGVMKYVGNQLDFSEKKYIEILAKVDTTYGHGDANVTLHVELGDISEDFYTFNGGEGFLNTEDGSADDLIDGVLTLDEDNGLDGVKDGLPGDDPFDSSNDKKNTDGDYLYINGTEGNSVLDTEDLDGNGTLNTLNRYFQYSVPLSSLNNEFLQSEYRGWKLYRIPIANANNYTTITNNSALNPSLSKISFARLWFEVDKTVRIKVAELNIVGNKWEERPIMLVHTEGDHSEETVAPDLLENQNTTILAGITDNQKDAHYTPPAGTYETSQGEQTLEQSLTMIVDNLQEKQHALLRQKSVESSNYLLYNKLRYWVYPELEEGDLNQADSLSIIIRIGADSLNYYEVKEKVLPIIYEPTMNKSSWKEIEIDFAEFTELKNLNMLANSTSDTLYTLNRRTFRKVGNPTLSNIKELNLGIVPEPNSTFTGVVYFNDIRVADPYQDAGYKARVTMNSKFADFYTLNVNLNKGSENFMNAPNRSKTSITNVQETETLMIDNNLSLHKLLPEKWKISMPLTFKYTKTDKTPRYKANSDILRDNLDEIEQDREKTITDNYQASWGYSKSKTNNPWSDYTVGSMTFSSNASLLESVTPTSADTTLTYSGTFSYRLNLSKVPKGVKLWRGFKINLLPSSFDNTYTFNARDPLKYTLTRTDTLVYWKKNSSTSNTEARSLTTSNAVVFPLLAGENNTYLSSTYKINTTRDLTYKNRIDDINIGEESKYGQEISYTFSPKLIESLWTVTSNGSVKFDENRSQVNPNSGFNDPEEEEDITQFKHSGNVNRNLNATVILKNSDLLQSVADFFTRDRGNNSDDEDDDRGVSEMSDKPKEGKDKRADDKKKPPKEKNKLKDKKDRMKPKNRVDEVNELHKEVSRIKEELANDKLNDDEIKKLEKFLDEVNSEIASIKKEDKSKEKEFAEHDKKDDFDIVNKDKKPSEKRDNSKELEELLAEEKKLNLLMQQEKLSDEELADLEDQLNDIRDQKLALMENEGFESTEEEETSPKRSFKINFKPSDIIVWLSKLENLEVDYSNTYKMVYTNLEERPSYSFQVAVPYSLKNEYIDSKTNDNNISVTSGIQLSKNISSDVSYSYDDKRSWSNSTNRVVTTTFPDISINFNEFQRYLGIDKVLTSSLLRSNYLYETKESGDIDWVKPKSSLVKIEFSPLIHWRANWINNVQTTISYSQSESEEIRDNNTFDVIKNNKNQKVAGNVNWSFKAVKGFDIPFIGRGLKIKNDMTLKTDYSWEKTFATTKGSIGTTTDTDLTKFSLTPGASYNFHRNIKGGTDFEYNLTTDKKTKRNVRTIAFSLWVEITF